MLIDKRSAFHSFTVRRGETLKYDMLENRELNWHIDVSNDSVITEIYAVFEFTL